MNLTNLLCQASMSLFRLWRHNTVLSLLKHTTTIQFRIKAFPLDAVYIIFIDGFDTRSYQGNLNCIISQKWFAKIDLL